ncbi:MAG: hypothetical protein LKF42_03380 [Streptococcaceae bacterium]|jgi:niacin transporter|nr:hypothetical protein [Streptococcaceae bacterium]MCH4176982.1 hypothetical protein [Streptococcaceae bacterium]
MLKLKQTVNLQKLTITAILIALGILIPMVMPKITIPPASFTLASHVPVMIAMFISPVVAILVALGTSLGFFLTGLPIIITLRALSHIVFAFIGALYIQKYGKHIEPSKALFPNWRFQFFNFWIGLIHAGVESIVVLLFYIGQPNPVDVNFYYYVFVLIGGGGLIHSLIDFNIAYFVVVKLKQIMPNSVFNQLKKEA